MSYENDLFEQRKLKDDFIKISHQSPLTKEQQLTFKELNYFPVLDKYKFHVVLKEFTQQTPVTMMTSKGDAQDYVKYAYLEFQVDSIDCMLTVYMDDQSDYLFVPFKDKTTGKDTYGAGRYIELEKIGEKEYLLDFNLAYNPYCAYNDRWVCPLTPFENILKVKICAGEKNFK
jgi:uncharacterized protein (DUF1684 family)